jgi:hypothetical protein
MKRPLPNDRVLTFKLNLSAVARTNTCDLSAAECAVQILRSNLAEIGADPSIVERTITWNGEPVGRIAIDWRLPPE